MRPENTIEVEEIEPEESGRRHLTWIGAGAVVVVALLALLPTANDPSPSEAVLATLPTPATAVERFEVLTPIAVAAEFVDAYGSFDVDRAASFLAPDAEISRLEGGRQWRLDNRWLEAVGFKLDLVSCESVESSASGVRVRCGYAFHALGSEANDLGPFYGSFDLRVRDGRIVWAFQTWHESPFAEDVWQPFTTWVAEAYPRDAEVMYAGSTPRFTKESIVRWEERSHEYAELGKATAAYRLRVRDICRAAAARLEEAWKASQEDLIAAGYDEPQAWMKVAAPIMEDAVAELREVAPPESVRARFERDYALLDNENEWLRLVSAGVDAEPPPGGPAAHNIQPSLHGCTSGG